MSRLTRSFPGVLALVVALVASVPAGTQQPRFLADDPLRHEPDSQDASKVQPWDIDLGYDLAHAYTVTRRRTPERVRAKNVNSIDDVPDSSWFTNRVGSRPVTSEEVRRGPNVLPAPDASSWTIVREKSAGAAAGFTALDARGDTYFVSFDAPSNPDGATGAIVVATKLFWALGYNQVENHLSVLRRPEVRIGPKASVRRPSGRRTRMTQDDIDVVLSRAKPRADGTYRVTAGRALSGKILGGFRYEGTRPDDPNDVIDHQHRREIRALRVFGAWTNLTDMKAGNTLDVLVTENGKSVVRHYLQDVGSTFGVGAAGPHDYVEGFEYVVQAGPSLRRLFSLGFALSPWQRTPFVEHPAIGRFESDAFDPDAWKPRAPVRSHDEMRDDDAFWAARKVMAFSDELIRAAVGAGEFSDPDASRLLADLLIKRRDRIGQTYLPRLNPVVDPALTETGLSFRNAAVDHGVATSPRRYLARWYAFDNTGGTSRELGANESANPQLALPAGLPQDDGAYVRVDVAAEHDQHASWKRPVEIYFRRANGSWALVGLTRLP